MRKRIAAMIAAIIMVALTVVLCSCESKSAKLIPVNEYDNPKMDQAVASEIKTAYFKKLSDGNLTDKRLLPKSAEDVYIRHYTDLSQCKAVYMGCNGLVFTCGLRTLEIDGYVFQFSNEVYFYKDGKIYSPNEAYDAGLITKDEAFETATFPASTAHRLDDPRIDQVVADEIKKAYFKKLSDENLTEKGSVYSPQSPSDLFIMCYYGNFSGCEAVMIGGDGIDYTEAYRPVYVAGYEIVFPSGQPLYMYKEGKFYLVKEAYDAGVITKNDVCELAEIFALLTENN